MENQFDRIGDILSETLKNGEIPDEYKNWNPAHKIKLKKTDGCEEALNHKPEQDENQNEKNQEQPEKINYSRIYTIVPELHILGIKPENLSKEGVKKAYHTAVKSVHPDTNRSFIENHRESALKIKQIRDAYKKVMNFLQENQK